MAAVHQDQRLAAPRLDAVQTPLAQRELTMADGTNEIEALSLTETVTNDQWATLSIDAPFTSGSLDGITAIGFHLTYDVTLGGGRVRTF